DAERQKRRCAGRTTPAEPDPPVSEIFGVGRRRATAEEEESGCGEDVEPRRARAAVRSLRAGVHTKAKLPDVIAELGERDALDLVELGARRGEVRRRPSLDQKQTFVVLVFRIPTTDQGTASRVGVRCEAPDAREARVRERDGRVGRAADSIEPGSLNEICLPWVELLRLDLEEPGWVQRVVERFG